MLAGLKSADLLSRLRGAERLLDGGDYDGAIEAYRDILNLAPALTSVNLPIGHALRAKRQPEQALAAYRGALSADSDESRSDGRHQRARPGAVDGCRERFVLCDHRASPSVQPPGSGESDQGRDDPGGFVLTIVPGVAGITRRSQEFFQMRNKIFSLFAVILGMALLVPSAFAQGGILFGRVTDAETGDAIAGAAVRLDGHSPLGRRRAGCPPRGTDQR